MNEFMMDALVETLCEEFDNAKDMEEVARLSQRIVALNNKVSFDNEQWGCMNHYQLLAMGRVSV